MKLNALFLAALILGACTSMKSKPESSQRNAPKIEDSMSLKEATNIGLKYGGDSLFEIRKRVLKLKEFQPLDDILTTALSSNLNTLADTEIANAYYLYPLSSKKRIQEVLEAGLADERIFVRQLAWQLASRFPSRDVAIVIERELSRAIWDGEEAKVLVPELAQAVQANQIKSVYTLVRQGLMTQGHEEFVKAMAALDPERAKKDFMAYLSLASLEDLRQLNQKSVNLYACMEIFRFYFNHPLPLADAEISPVFFFAISRNQALAEMAQNVIERQLDSQRRAQLALTLARLPAWIQIAYVESHKQSPNPNVALFLNELKKTTAHKGVIEELETQH